MAQNFTNQRIHKLIKNNRKLIDQSYRRNIKETCLFPFGSCEPLTEALILIGTTMFGINF